MKTIIGWTNARMQSLITQGAGLYHSFHPLCTNSCRKRCEKDKKCQTALPDGMRNEDEVISKFFCIPKRKFYYRDILDLDKRLKKWDMRERLIAKFRNIAFDRCWSMVVTIKRGRKYAFNRSQKRSD